jgi:hypothetical protein
MVNFVIKKNLRETLRWHIDVALRTPNPARAENVNDSQYQSSTIPTQLIVHSVDQWIMSVI